MTYSNKISDQQHQKTVLANGLTILSLNKIDISSVMIEIWLKVGSSNESSKENGIAHFIEHMNFKGTQKRDAKTIAEEFDAIGGYLNAYTSKQHTVYSAKILSEHLEIALDMLADIIFSSIYDEQEIEKEKNVILQELAQAQDNPEDMVFEYFAEVVYPNQAVGRSILGTEETINSFTRNDIINFIHQHYIAKNIIVAAAGDLSHSQLVDLVNRKITPFSEQQIQSPEKIVYHGGHKFKLDPELAQVQLVIGYEGVSVYSNDYYKIELLANILGGSISSRLFQEIREKRALVYNVGSFCQYHADSGIFAISLAASADKITEILEVLSEEIRSITSNITQDELNRSLAQIKAALLMSRESTDSWVGILAGNYSLYDRYIDEKEIWEKYNEVTLQEIHLLAKTIFSNQKNISVAVLGNINNLPSYSTLQNLLTI